MMTVPGTYEVIRDWESFPFFYLSKKPGETPGLQEIHKQKQIQNKESEEHTHG